MKTEWRTQEEDAQWGLAEMRKASQLPDSPVPANDARSPELERYAIKGNLVHSEGRRVYKRAHPRGCASKVVAGFRFSHLGHASDQAHQRRRGAHR